MHWIVKKRGQKTNCPLFLTARLRSLAVLELAKFFNLVVIWSVWRKTRGHWLKAFSVLLASISLALAGWIANPIFNLPICWQSDQISSFEWISLHIQMLQREKLRIEKSVRVYELWVWTTQWNVWTYASTKWSECKNWNWKRQTWVKWVWRCDCGWERVRKRVITYYSD